jgi:hypothetical protein
MLPLHSPAPFQLPRGVTHSHTGSYMNVLPAAGWAAGDNTIQFSLPMNWTVIK